MAAVKPEIVRLLQDVHDEQNAHPRIVFLKRLV